MLSVISFYGRLPMQKISGATATRGRVWGAVAKRRRESADRTGREGAFARRAGPADHRVRKQETASLGDLVTSSPGTAWLVVRLVLLYDV